MGVYEHIFRAAHQARASLMNLDERTVNDVLNAIADEIGVRGEQILAENGKDLARMDKANPMYDRLLLTPERLDGIAQDMRNVAALASPVGTTVSEHKHANGMNIRRVVVPFGVIGVIYEARPNVTFDVFALCFKTQNVCLLKGGSDAADSNAAIARLIRDVLERFGINPDVCTLMPCEREATAELMKARKYVDLIIPRGSQKLINYVLENSVIPIIETGAGICHTYFHEAGDREKCRRIVLNAKTRRVSVCNALDCLIVDRSRLTDLACVCADMAAKNVVIYADEEAYAVLDGKYPEELLRHAGTDTFGTEFLDYRMAVKTVAGMKEALQHIADYSSKHSEAIVSEDARVVELFERMVDAACVYANASTAFTDGAQFGLGAEIGISTQKMHARGPMGLAEICSYKWIIDGDGQIRS